MSIFGTPLQQPAATTGFSFGSTTAASSAMPSTGSGFQLPTIGATTSVATAPTAGSGFPVPAVSGAAVSTSVGLGGQNQSTVTLTGIQQNGTQTQITKPKDSQVPPELLTLVDGLRKQIKTNKDLSDQLATTSMKHVRELGGQLKQSSQLLTRINCDLQRTAKRAMTLKDESRHDLRQIEMVQRRQEAIPVHHYGMDDQSQPINYLHELAANYEQQLKAYREHLTTLEEIIATRANQTDTAYNQVTSGDIINHLERMDVMFKFVAAQVYRVHEEVKDVKDQYVRYLRTLHGEFAPNPFPEKARIVSKTSRNLEGPDPFATPSQSVLFGMAGTLPKTTQQIGVAPAPPTVGFGTPSQSLFGSSTIGQPGSLFGSSGSVWPTTATTSSTSFFRPLSTATTTSTVTPAFGATTTTTSGVFPRFSTPFNNSSSGTIFPGGATNIGLVKPLGT